MNRNEDRCATKICFVAPGLTAVYSLLSGKNPEKIGGPDVHLFFLIKELIKHYFKLSIIVDDEGGAPIEDINGIEVIKIHKAPHRSKIANIVLEPFRIWNAMHKTKANIYFQRGGIFGVVSLICRLIGRKFVYSIASDAFVNRDITNQEIKGFGQHKFELATFGNWLDIKLADAVVVQNEYQMKMLKKNFNRDGVLIKKPFPLTERGMPEKAEPPIVLWVGAMAEVKQPELFLKLAETMPEAKFQIIGGPSGDEELYDRIREKSEKISNFEFVGVVPFHKTNKYFRQASILVNTSIFEAYPPHAFIQAWMNYTPIASLHDNSDERLCGYNMGFHSKTFNQLVKDVKYLLKNEHMRNEMSRNGRLYVEREHDIKKIIENYIKLFHQLEDH